MPMSSSQYRRLSYLRRLQGSSRAQRANFYRGHPRHDPQPNRSPDSPFALWASISGRIGRLVRNLKSRERWRIRRALKRRILRRAQVAETRVKCKLRAAA